MTGTRTTMRIGTRSIGGGAPLFVIAEIGLNHDGDAARALALVDAAARAGASAVKLQSLRAETLVAPDRATGGATLTHVAGPSLRDVFARYELDEAAHRAVAARARQHGLAWLSSPFDEAAVDMLTRLDCDALKIASGDITHHRLIARAAATGRPLVISTGLSTLDEVAAAVTCARQGGAGSVALLHCVSAYPTPDDQQNLAAIRTLATVFSLPVGLSDHTGEASGVAAAVALGADLYERHIKASDTDPVIDAAVSSSPEALARLVAIAAQTRARLGSGLRVPQAAEEGNRRGSRRALYASRDLPAGTVIAETDVIALRPEQGLPARRWRELVGTRTTRAIAAFDAFRLEDAGGAASDDSPLEPRA
ncbi:MAG: N-acetylneuraminate synthase family protein [Vicinamibacteraceae bacterium]